MSGITAQSSVSIQHLSLLCIKLQELNAEWEQFGSMLHVKHDTLQQIKSNPERSSVRNKMTSVLNEWKKAKGAKTWRVIYDAVKKLNNNALAERIQQLHDLDSTVGTDKEDYIDNMLKTLEEVIPQYNQFGLYLGLHHNVLQEIEGGRLTAEECMKQLIVIWIREKGDKATIYEIIEACRRMNHDLAEKLENDSEIKKTFGMNGGTHQVQRDIQEQVSRDSSDDRKQVKTNDTSNDSSPMEMSHNHFEEDVDDGSVQNTVEEEIQENDNNQTTDDGVRRRTRPISENNTPSPAAAVIFSNENRLTGKTLVSVPFIWAKEHPWVTSIIILTAMVLCGVVWVILVIYKIYSGK